MTGRLLWDLFKRRPPESVGLVVLVPAVVFIEGAIVGSGDSWGVAFAIVAAVQIVFFTRWFLAYAAWKQSAIDHARSSGKLEGMRDVTAIYQEHGT